MQIRELQVEGYERVVVAREGAYHAVVALHSTVLGPAVGGTRLWRYTGEDAALADALRLARGMTYKNALAGLGAGGGKAVILAPERLSDRTSLFESHGRLLERLAGSYVTAEDVGTSPADMDVVSSVTRWVAGTSARAGDPSPWTARGVFRAVQAAVRHRWGRRSLEGVGVAIQGCGAVGGHLARELASAGASLTVADVAPERAERIAEETGAAVVSPDAVFDASVEVFAPCALGAVLDGESVPRLRAAVVAGAANNQLATPEDGRRLAARGILYIPDYAANAGGVITGFHDLHGWPLERVHARVETIHDTVLEILALADQEGLLPGEAADRMAEARIAAGPSGESWVLGA